MDKPKIVVIDDPISSLDSNVLFIVSTLVREIISDCRKNTYNIKQIFILTHNVYFHNEVTYKSRAEKFNDELYYIVRKIDNQSFIKENDENPIKSTYQLLWNEISNNDTSTESVSVLNAMRRILENYFKIIGNINYEERINEFEGEDKLIARSLVAYINEGSHSISDDFSVSMGPDDIGKYKKVFRSIFEKLGHIEHYKMMMKEE